jgi:phosphatidylglycerol:prolipoprotein diacylglycerol transferase
MHHPLIFPQFDPVMLHLGPISIRWYAVAYIVSLILGWRLARRTMRLSPAVATLQQTDDFLTWATLGVVLGGRIGYVLFYNLPVYASHPLDAFAVWQGGMSFHGGAIGVTIAILLFCRRNRIPILGFADRIAVSVPIGLGFGRIANFINGELWGRPAPAWLPWAMIFPNSTPVDGVIVPRHPSQIYQALMEGVILFALLFWLSRSESVRSRFGTLTGTFLCGYAVARFIGELFRQPDPQLGYLWLGLTMGQYLSLPMFVAGASLIVWARRRIRAEA